MNSESVNHQMYFLFQTLSKTTYLPMSEAGLLIYILLVINHRVNSDKVHRLLVSLSYFWPDRIVQILSLIPILILLLYLLVSKDLKFTGLCELVAECEQLYSKFNSNCSGVETTSSFNTYK